MLKSQHIGDRSAHLYTQWAALEQSAGALPNLLVRKSAVYGVRLQPTTVLR